MKKILIIAKREYLKVVKKPTFWFSTFALPAFIVVVSLISGLSASSVEEKISSQINSVNAIAVLDELNIVTNLSSPFVKVSNLEDSIGQVQKGNFDALILVPQNLLESKKLEIYQKDIGVFLANRFNDLAVNLIKESIINSIDNPILIEAYKLNYNVELKQFSESGELVGVNLEKFVLPAVATFIYFLLTTFASSYMLLSVSEEKENRTIEMVLSSVSPKELIWGKILGLLGIVITQVLLLLIVTIVIIFLFAPQVLSIVDFSKINLSLGNILLTLFYTLAGFVFLAGVMVGVGASMPNYKDAASLSSIFIILSIIPIYFVTLIVADPSGPVSIILSYFPFTAPILLLFRSTLGVMSLAEIIFSIVLVGAYTMCAVYVAFKLFLIGSLEYSAAIKLGSIFNFLLKKR